MTGRGYLFVASRLAFSRRGSNLFSAIIVTALSLLPLVVAIEVAQGMTQGIIMRYLETSSYHFRAMPLEDTPDAAYVKQISTILREETSVVSVTPERQNFAMAFTSSGRQGVLLRGLDAHFYSKDPVLREYMTFSSGNADLNAHTVVIGESLAKNLNLKVGDTIRLLSVQEESKTPLIRSYSVGGIFSVGYYDLDKSWVLIDESQKVFFNDRKATQFFLGIKVVQPFFDVNAQKYILQELLPPNWLILDWPHMNYAMIENFRITTLMLLFVLALVVCVAVINNTGALQIFFLSRRKEIALMLAMGARPSDIHHIFLGLGLLVGLCGAVLGVLLGVLLSFNINTIILLLETLSNVFDTVVHGQMKGLGRESFYLEKIRIHVQSGRLLVLVLFVTVWSVLVNYCPARKISRSKVLSILRKI